MILDDTTLPPINEDPAQQTIVNNDVSASTEPNFKELYLRTNADFLNFKKRIDRERAEMAVVLQGDAIEQVLPIITDLDLALTTAEQNGAQQAWLDGFSLILKNAKKRLQALGLEEIAATGKFNPNEHEALMHVDSPEHTSGDIVQVLEKGYALKGRVIKYARVSVAK
jgi:molecular chaperone GrpE